MKYLVCFLNDQDYTEPEFAVYDNAEDAFCGATKRFSYLIQKKSAKLEIEHKKEKIRLTWSCNNQFCVSEILPFNEEKGDFLLVWHHAYDGVDFLILNQTSTYNECIEERITTLKEMATAGEICDEDFDFDTDTCVDTGNEWEIFSIIDTNQNEEVEKYVEIITKYNNAKDARNI